MCSVGWRSVLLGPFTADFRNDINTILQENLVEFNIPHTPGADMQSTLVDPVKQRQWQLAAFHLIAFRRRMQS